MGAAWAAASRTSLGSAASRQSSRTEASAVEEDLPAPFAGSCVVDICSGRRAWVLGVSKTHCKVRFEPPPGAWTSDEQEKSEILPMERMRVWSARWDGFQRPSSENPNLKGGLRASENLGVVIAEDAFVGSRQLPTLPALLTCTAAPQALVPKPPSRRVPNVSLLRLVGSSSDSEEDLMTKRKKTAIKFNSNDPGDHDKEGQMLLNRFKKVAKARFGGSLGAAWHAVLDVRGAGRVGFQDFVRGGRALGFTGNYRKLWAALTVDCRPEDGGLIGFDTLDPQGAKILDEFRNFFIAQGMTLEDLWEQYLDADGSGRCLRDEFLTKMCELGWVASKARQLFRMLDVGGQQDLSLDELEIVGLPRRPVQRDLTGRELLQRQDQQARERVLSDFHGYLIKTFGSVVRGWRLGLDSDGDGKLRFTEFCIACKEFGFRGALKTLWRALDKKKVGYISLEDLDLEAKEQVDEFRSFLEDNYRTLDDVWERVFDVNGSGRCSMETFVEACHEKLQWPGNARRMFRWLDLHARGVLTIDQMEFLGMRRRVVNRPTAKQKIMERQAKDRAEAQAVLGRFKVYLTQRCGNLVRAWRHELDPDGDKRLQFTEFCASCRRIGFQGNLKALWMSLDSEDTGYICLEELDPDAVEHLEDFKMLLRIFFDDLDTSWYSTLDPDNSGRCSWEEFRTGCNMVGFRRGAQQLFKYLDLRGEGFLELEMLEVLELPRAAQREAAMKYALSSVNKTRDDFEEYLKAKFGSLVHAWRNVFCSSDVRGQFSEKVNVEEFCGKCREIGFAGHYPKLWAQLLIEGGSDMRNLADLCRCNFHAPTDDADAQRPKLLRRKSMKGIRPVSPSGHQPSQDGKDGKEKLPRRKTLTGQAVHPSLKEGESSAGESSVRQPVDDSLPMTKAKSAPHHGDGADASGAAVANTAAAKRARKAAAQHRAQVAALGYLTLRHLDPEVFTELNNFREFCAPKFETSDGTWRALLKECLETNFKARLWKVEFAQAVHMIGYTGDAQVIFDACDLIGQKTISAEELRFLQIGGELELDLGDDIRRVKTSHI